MTYARRSTPLTVGSPFFTTLPLPDHGLDWVQPRAPLVHPAARDSPRAS